MSASVRYHIAAADPAAHLFEVRCTVTRPAAAGQVFRLPSWLRGSYLVRDFAKHVVDVSAECAGQPVAIERLDKRSLRCAPVPGTLTLRTRIYAYDDSVRKAYLDASRGFFNASSLCYCPDGCADGPMEVELARRDGWQVATTLPALDTDADGFGVYRAADYEELLDHPVEMAAFLRVGFDVDGIPHSFILSGRCDDLDASRLTRDAQKICAAQRALFGNEPKMERYLFLTRVVAAGYGGLEHRTSTALICSRGDLPRRAQPALTREYRGFLGLVSHEYFHLWNVKRITAQKFAESDLGAEAYTRDLWHYEGITSYYDDLMLLRAGVIDAPAYLDLVAENATRLWRSPGRHLHSLADASFETWIKYYQPDENANNATTSYYVKGALLALCLDLHLRRHSTITLDEVMRALWTRYGAPGQPAPEGALEAVAAELSGLPLQEFFDRGVRSTQDPPFAETLAEFGVLAQPRAAVNDADGGGRNGGTAPAAQLGLKLKPGETVVAQVRAGGPAQRAGISPGDQLVALDGLRLSAANWSTRGQTLHPSRACRVEFFRGDELMRAQLQPETPPADTWTLTLAEASGATLERRRAWLGA